MPYRPPLWSPADFSIRPTQGLTGAPPMSVNWRHRLGADWNPNAGVAPEAAAEQIFNLNSAVISQYIAAQRQAHGISGLQYRSHRLTMPRLTIEYVNNQGMEAVTITAEPAGVTIVLTGLSNKSVYLLGETLSTSTLPLSVVKTGAGSDLTRVNFNPLTSLSGDVAVTCYIPNKLVIYTIYALSNTPYMYASLDNGITWKSVPNPNGMLYAVYGNGVFVASDYVSQIYTSLDSINWTTGAFIGQGRASNLQFINGLFFLSESNSYQAINTFIATSADGTHWGESAVFANTSVGSGNNFGNYSVSKVTYNSDTKTYTCAGQTISDVGGWVTGGTAACIAYSNDGYNWSPMVKAYQDPNLQYGSVFGASSFLKGISYGNGLYVGGGVFTNQNFNNTPVTDEANQLITSTDGVSWKVLPPLLVNDISLSNPNRIFCQIKDVMFFENRWYAVGAYFNSATSTYVALYFTSNDGLIWTQEFNALSAGLLQWSYITVG